MTTSNPFFEPSDLPYELPPFARIRNDHFLPAFTRGMADQRDEVAAIGSGAEPATFENTVEALERSGAVLGRVRRVFFNKVAADTDEEIQALEVEITPRLAAHDDLLLLDPALFDRLDGLYEQRGKLGLDEEQLRLLERHHTHRVRAGARLAPEQQRRLRELNAEIAALSTEFGQNLRTATAAAALVLDRAEELAGLPADRIAAAAEQAQALGHPGKFALALKNFSCQTELAALEDPALRERLLAASLGRGTDSNGPIAVSLAGLRAERAALLGYPSHAAWEVADRTAGTTAAVEELFGRLVAPAVANAEREGAALAEAAGVAEIGAADWQYYSERVRKERFDLDTAALRPYLELDTVLHDGVFHAAGLVYGITFTRRPDLVSYHPDAHIYEVHDADGSPLGLYIGDFHARESKRGGAWMDSLVAQSKLLGQRPVVVNNLNVAKPPAGEPVLLSWSEVNTLFHEFGHALHGLFSDVRYPLLSGTRVPRDFVEFPSQVNEMWADWPEVLAHYARHHVTGEPMPAELPARLREAENFGAGFRMVEHQAAAVLDWAWHTLSADGDVPGEDEAAAFEAAALERYGLAMAAIPPRYRTGYFAHIFSGGYAAGYYGYRWAEVLDADTVRWFRENGRTIRESGEIFRRELLGRGGSVDPLAAFRAVVGRDAEIGPLLDRHGLTD
ncbi:M3 family metallopeptidase [Streptomyces sp. P9-2B-2]|uniref:M3 family metallopeptidase n=1 Tax=Streptomyces TaxID=1883 RepID=UPI00225B4F8B|nr:MULTISPECIES: M3 family metallopeptidase [Streptomyces]MCX4638840.1 M3 family metallopeptidase [Streptomyces platensis]WJY42420.1 M3 family metallopeptidase [Streptomyces sp. P9-2B-2]